MEILLLVVFIGIIIWAFATNVLWGIILLIALGVYYYCKRLSGLFVMLALRCYAKEDIKGCFRWFERAHKRGMDTMQKINYAYYLLREGRVERSENLLNSMLAFSMKPELKNLAKANHALLLLKTGRPNEAIEELEEIFPNYKTTAVYSNLGYLYIVQGNLEKAQSFNHEAYEYNSDNAIILDNMVQLYIKLGDYEKAYEYAAPLMEKQPTFIEAYYDAALVEKELGKYDEAREHLTHALTIRTTFLSTVTHEAAQELLDSLPA